MRSVLFLVSLFVVFTITLGHGGHSTTHGVIDKYSIRPPYAPDRTFVILFIYLFFLYFLTLVFRSTRIEALEFIWT